MKTITIVFFLIVQLTTTFAQSNEKLKVVSSASMISDMVYQIAQDKLDQKLIVPIGGDPHLHEPTPRDAKIVAAADQIFVNGLTFEGWITELIANSGTAAVVDTVTEGIDAIQSTTYKDSYDPHAWMDVENGMKYVVNIKNSLVKLDPDNAAYYEENCKQYLDKLKSLDQYIKDRIQEIPADKRILITSHDAFEYYGKKYGLKLEAIMGISTEAEAQTSDIIRITNTIKEFNVPAIFIESTINPKLMEQIAKDAGIIIGGKLYADSIGDKTSPAPSYYDMLKHNTDIIVDALTATKAASATIEDQAPSKSKLLYYIIGLIAIGGLILIITKLNK